MQCKGSNFLKIFGIAFPILKTVHLVSECSFYALALLSACYWCWESGNHQALLPAGMKDLQVIVNMQ